MQANEMTFGVEIETLSPKSLYETDSLRIGSHYIGIQVPYLPEGWKASDDSSLSPSPDEDRCEIVSPILRGAEGLAAVKQVCDTLRAKGHRVNHSCGVHVHIGWNPRERSGQELSRLVCAVGYAEPALYAMTGTKAREQGGWARSVKRHGNERVASAQSLGMRYHILNLSNLASGSKDTVEFRCFSGTVEGLKVCAWVQVCLGLVLKAITCPKKMRFVGGKPMSEKNSLARGKAGEKELTRLLECLNWRREKALHLGMVEGGPFTRKEMCKELTRLARKYDAANTERAAA